MAANRAPREWQEAAIYIKQTSLPALMSVMARSKKALPDIGKTSKILKAELKSVERIFSETQEEVDWEEHPRPSGTEGPPHSTCQKAPNPWDGVCGLSL